LYNPTIKQDVKQAGVVRSFVTIQPESKKLFHLLLDNKRFEILLNKSLIIQQFV
jgi:F-type H+-transporting ATPase subunit delta